MPVFRDTFRKAPAVDYSLLAGAGQEWSHVPLHHMVAVGIRYRAGLKLLHLFVCTLTKAFKLVSGEKLAAPELYLAFSLTVIIIQRYQSLSIGVKEVKLADYQCSLPILKSGGIISLLHKPPTLEEARTTQSIQFCVWHFSLDSTNFCVPQPQVNSYTAGLG